MSAPVWEKKAERTTPEEFASWRSTIADWSGSAFLADERMPRADESEAKVNLYSMLCRLLNHMHAWEDEACSVEADHAAEVEAAVQAEREETRERCRRAAVLLKPDEEFSSVVSLNSHTAAQIAVGLAIEALDLGPTDALAAALAKAREDALRECEAAAMACQQENLDMDLPDMAAGSGEVVSAIRALAGKEQGK